MLIFSRTTRFVTFVKIPLKRYSVSPVCRDNMKVFTQKRNPLTGDTEWDIEDENYDYHQEIARSAFADMLHDKERNEKYYRALKLAIEKMHASGKKANVLDIGTGTGLLSIMAAKCNADSIVACEAFKPMAECCLKILEKNGVSDKIKLIPKRSTEITVGDDGDMKEKANILVTEVFDTELIGEGAISTFSHAHKHLLEEDCIVVPDSAVMYAQVIECPSLQKWNKINDLFDEDLDMVLKTPQKMKDCAGSAAVHDIQLSQLSRTAFTELSDNIAVFYYDWSGKTPIDKNKTVKQEFSVTATGTAQMVFMWWELNMDQEGKIVLSCAPWWSHPDTDLNTNRPQDTIPWRDHWMQAVYYLPKEVPLQKNNEVSLISCQDEYSLWFYLEDKISYKHYKRPICECGVHMALSRTHVSYLNDGKRSKKFLAEIKETIDKKSTVLDLNGASLMGLAASKYAKKVYILESAKLNIDILNDYIKENDLSNVTVVNKISDASDVTNVICDPNFVNSILPWENLKMVYLLYKNREYLSNVNILPESVEFWVMPVQFNDLHKIRMPLDICESIDMRIFDGLVENSRTISDSELEAQPLWEYPCKCRSEPTRIMNLNFQQLKPTYAGDGTCKFSNPSETFVINAFVVWATWSMGGKFISSGPTEQPEVDQYVNWDMHTRQGVKILKYPVTMTQENTWSYQVVCDLEKGQFDLNFMIDDPEQAMN